MPNRLLREGILSSKRIAKLSWPAEVFYRRLISVVDDFGRYYATPTLLRAACYPLQLDKVSDQDVGKWLGETRKADLVREYESGGEPYLELLDFRQQVRAKKSKFPDVPPLAGHVQSVCAADAQQVPANAHLVVVEVEDVVDVGAAPKARKKAKTPLPAEFGLTERVIDWAKANGFGRLQEHLDNFRLKAAAHDYRYADWDSAFMGAIKADWAGVNGKAAQADKFAGAL